MAAAWIRHLKDDKLECFYRGKTEGGRVDLRAVTAMAKGEIDPPSLRRACWNSDSKDFHYIPKSFNAEMIDSSLGQKPMILIISPITTAGVLVRL